MIDNRIAPDAIRAMLADFPLGLTAEKRLLHKLVAGERPRICRPYAGSNWETRHSPG